MESKITSLTPNPSGNWTSKQGDDYVGILISFENGDSGTCSAKNYPPPYAIGDLAEYQQKGDYNGVPKFVGVKKAGSGEQSYSSNNKSGGSKSTYDTLGPQIGHALSNATTVILAHGEEIDVENLMKYSKIYFIAAAKMRKAIEAKVTPPPATPTVNQDQANANVASESQSTPLVDPEEDLPF